MSRLARAGAVVGVALAQLRRSRARTAFAVGAVALAVLSVTLLASLGIGVVSVGEERMDEADRDVWITSDPVDGEASANAIVDVHDVTADVYTREEVSHATPIATHEVYLGTDPDDVESVTAVGVPETHSSFEYEAGGGFSVDDPEAAADPPHDPEPTELVLDPEIAAAHDVSVGDTVYVGASRHSAGENAFTVVGIGGYYSQFLGDATATVPLAELQGVAGTRGADRASFVTIQVADDADPEAVRDDLAADYPAYDVRTNDAQLQSMLVDRAPVVAGGVTLVGLAAVGGVVLTTNLFALVASQQRTELAALGAIGLSRPVIAGTIAVQALVIGLLGGALAMLATPLLTAVLNRFAASTVGFQNLLQTPPAVYAVGFAVAVVVGVVAATVAGWRAGRFGAGRHLEL